MVKEPLTEKPTFFKVKIVEFNRNSGHLYITHDYNNPNDFNGFNLPALLIATNEAHKTLLAAQPKFAEVEIGVIPKTHPPALTEVRAV